MIWRTLYEMVRDSRMKSSQYLNFILNNLRTEMSDTIIEEQLGYLHICITQYTPFEARENLFSQAYQAIKSYLLEINENQTNRLTILKDKLIAFANSENEKR